MGLKFNCPNASCRQRIEVEDALAGTEVSCPKCSAKVSVPKSHDIRFTCHTKGCGQHIVVDVSEAGRFIKCPACSKPQRIPGDPPKSSFPEPAGIGSFESRLAGQNVLGSLFRAGLSRMLKHEDKVVQWFFVVSLLVLLLMGLSKIATWRWKPWYPDGKDLVFNLPLNRLMAAIGVIECCVAVACARFSSLRVSACVLLWFGCNWCVYRTGQRMMGQRRGVPALGSWGKSLGLGETTVDNLMIGFAVAMVFGSAIIIWRQSKAEAGRLEEVA